jgi:hypothetical protein
MTRITIARVNNTIAVGKDFSDATRGELAAVMMELLILKREVEELWESLDD